MPVSIHVADHGAGVVLKSSGIVTGVELVRAHVNFVRRSEESLSNILYWYADHSDAEAQDISAKDIWTLAQLAIEMEREKRNLYVAVCKPRGNDYGLTAMWEAYVNQTSWTIRVVTSPEEAKDWLRNQVNHDLRFD